MPLGGARRIGRPGLIGTMARTAVIAGTANAVVGGMNRRESARRQEAAEAAGYRASPEVPSPAPPAPPAPTVQAPVATGVDRLTLLEQLGSLRQQGVLSEDEFAAEKARILQS